MIYTTSSWRLNSKWVNIQTSHKATANSPFTFFEAVVLEELGAKLLETFYDDSAYFNLWDGDEHNRHIENEKGGGFIEVFTVDSLSHRLILSDCLNSFFNDMSLNAEEAFYVLHRELRFNQNKKEKHYKILLESLINVQTSGIKEIDEFHIPIVEAFIFLLKKHLPKEGSSDKTDETTPSKIRKEEISTLTNVIIRIQNDHGLLDLLKSDSDKLIQALLHIHQPEKMPVVYLGCKTLTFAYFIEGLKRHFPKLKLTSSLVERSGKFVSKDQNIIRRNNLNSSKSQARGRSIEGEEHFIADYFS